MDELDSRTADATQLPAGPHRWTILSAGAAILVVAVGIWIGTSSGSAPRGAATTLDIPDALSATEPAPPSASPSAAPTSAPSPTGRTTPRKSPQGSDTDSDDSPVEPVRNAVIEYEPYAGSSIADGWRSVVVPVTVTNAGKDLRTTVTVRFFDDGGVVDTQSRTFSASGHFQATFRFHYEACGFEQYPVEIEVSVNLSAEYSTPKQVTLVGQICNPPPTG